MLSLQLLEPTIYINTNSDLNNAIRGTISLNLDKPTKIQSILVRFDGKMELKNHVFQKKKPIAHQVLNIYPSTEYPVLKSGHTRIGFEMHIPSRLIETVDCQLLKVKYHVTAIIKYTSSSSKHCKKPVYVTRLPYESILLNENTPIDSRTHKTSWLNYQVLINKKAIVLDSDLPITFRLLPQQQDISVDRITIQLLERRDVFKKDQWRSSHSIHTLLLCKHPEQPFPPKHFSDRWEDTVVYKIPKSAVHSTQTYAEFHISHILVISLLISKKRKQKMLTFQSQIDLLAPFVGELEQLKLPTYDIPPPFDPSHTIILPEYDRKFVDLPPSYSEIFM